MVFASLVVEKLRLIMFLSQSVTSSLVLGLSAVVGCSSLLSRVKPLTRQSMVPISAGQLAELFMARAWKNCLPFSVTNSSFIPNSGPPMPYFSRYKRPSLLIPAPLALTEI